MDILKGILNYFENKPSKEVIDFGDSYRFQFENEHQRSADEKHTLDEDKKVKVNPFTSEQLKGYELKEIQTLIDLFSDEQINSVPDVIHTSVLTREDKINLLLDNFPKQFENGVEYTYFIDKDYFLKKHTIQDEFTPQEISKTEFVSKDNVFFEKKEIQLTEDQKVEVIPASEDQKKQASKHSDGEQYSDLPSVDFPSFSEAQLKSVPDVIHGIPITDHEKKLILLNSYETTEKTNMVFSIDPNNKLIATYLDIDQNMEPYEVKRHISKADVMYVNHNEMELNIGNYENLTAVPIENEKLKSLADQLNNYYNQAGETMWNFNRKEGIEILEFTMHLHELPENVKNLVLDYLLLEYPVRPDFRDYTDNIYDGERLFDEAIENYISKELPDYKYKEKSLSQVLNTNGISTESLPPIKPFEVDCLNILLNDVTRILADNNKETKDLKEQPPILNVYQVNTDGQVYFKTLQKNLEVGDRINLLTKDGDLYSKGKVTHISKGEIQLGTDTGIIIAPFNSRIEPLFLNNSQNKKIDIKYAVDETIKLLDILLDQKKINLHENYFGSGNRMNDFMELLKGNKTSILPFDNGQAEGKLQILENFDGKLFASIDLKSPLLNIQSQLVKYGNETFILNNEQKEKLKKTGELGLVNLTNSNTNKDSKLWVSVDKELNKIVTQKNDAIKINNIFGTIPTEEQKKILRSGEGVLLEIKGSSYFIIASAASKNSDGLRHFTESKAREFQLIPSKNIENSNDKTKGMKF